MRGVALLLQNIDVSHLWSDDLGDTVRQRLREAVGMALIALTFVIAAALATWSVRDPSLSHATSAPVHNLLGLPGAIVADLMMQLIGLASIALLAPLAAWGCRLLTHSPLRRKMLRMCLWLVGVMLAAGFVACLPRTASWPLPTGLGGVAGDLVLRAPAAVFGQIAGPVATVIAVILASGALAALAIASGFGLQSEPEERADAGEDEAGAIISIGWIVHGFLSAKAQLTR